MSIAYCVKGLENEPHIETNSHPDTADWGAKWRQNTHALFHAPILPSATLDFQPIPTTPALPALFQHRTPLDFHIEQVQLLIPLRNFSLLINPYQGILNLLSPLYWLVDPHIDRQSLSRRLTLETFDEVAIRCRTYQSDRFSGRRGNIVACFWEEEGLVELVKSMD